MLTGRGQMDAPSYEKCFPVWLNTEFSQAFRISSRLYSNIPRVSSCGMPIFSNS
jgi:hypothetical protein